VRKTAISILAPIVAAVFYHNAWGQIYQYTDKNGNVIFLDKQPADSNAKKKELKEDGVYLVNQSELDYPSY